MGAENPATMKGIMPLVTKADRGQGSAEDPGKSRLVDAQREGVLGEGQPPSMTG